MQIKKDEIRYRILKEAEKEFLKKGYINSSLRRIVKNSGTTIGNFYNYFKNKEDLFNELVKEDYDNYIKFINNHDSIQRPDYLLDMNDIGLWRKILSELIQKVMPVFSDRLLILLECSKGTKYEKSKEILQNIMKEHFMDHMISYAEGFEHPEFSDIIAKQMLDGIIMIIKKHKDKKLRKDLLTEYILFCFIGSIGLLGKWGNKE